ncbi:hypothetical protein R6Q59_012232 [Mikania micrantha]
MEYVTQANEPVIIPGWQVACDMNDKQLTPSELGLSKIGRDTFMNQLAVVGDPCDPAVGCPVICRVGVPNCCNGWQVACDMNDKQLAPSEQGLSKIGGDTFMNQLAVVGDPCDPAVGCPVICRVGVPNCCNGSLLINGSYRPVQSFNQLDLEAFALSVP